MSYIEDEFHKLTDELGEGEQTPPVRSVILSPISSASALAAGLQMVGTEARVLQTSNGSAAYLEEPAKTGQEEELAALLGEERPQPEQVAKLAGLISKMAKGGAVALTCWTSAEPEGMGGILTARRFVAGKAEDKLPAGLVLANQDLAIEELLLGRLTPDQVEALYVSSKWTGWLRGHGIIK